MYNPIQFVGAGLNPNARGWIYKPDKGNNVLESDIWLARKLRNKVYTLNGATKMDSVGSRDKPRENTSLKNYGCERDI